tara:strand:+ start:409 stop:1131 length:723 start_codon:yes stop_codon:yes gene_type:complete
LKILLIIPARFESSRFPGKPLALINGISMLERTFLQCKKAFDHKSIYVATDDIRIMKFCKEKKINAIQTSKRCLTGTDRVAEVAKKIQADTYLNVQGDEPLFNPLDIKKLISESKKNPSNILCGYTLIKDKSLFFDSQIPKVVFDKKFNLLYMSRNPIPGNKENKFDFAYRQVCAYSFPRKDLLLFSSLKNKSLLEGSEDLELLRFLEMGKKIKMIKMSDASISVDNPDDIKKVESILIK